MKIYYVRITCRLWLSIYVLGAGRIVRLYSKLSPDYTQKHTPGMILDERLSRRTDLYLITNKSQENKILATGGIRTLSTTKRAAADILLTLLGHPDQISKLKG